MSSNLPRFRGLAEDCETWFIKTSNKKYEWKTKKFSQNQLYNIFKSVLAEYEKVFLPLYNKGEKTQDEAIDEKDKITKHILTHALEGFTDQTWEELIDNPEISRGSLKNLSEDVWAFLREFGTKEEILLLRQRLGLA